MMDLFQIHSRHPKPTFAPLRELEPVIRYNVDGKPQERRRLDHKESQTEKAPDKLDTAAPKQPAKVEGKTPAPVTTPAAPTSKQEEQTKTLEKPSIEPKETPKQEEASKRKLTDPAKSGEPLAKKKKQQSITAFFSKKC